MSIGPETYQSYLFCFRRHDKTQPWRITVRDTETEKQHHFATLNEAVTFLHTQLRMDELDQD